MTDTKAKLDSRTRRLVVAARALAYSDSYFSSARALVAELDAAVEEFAEDVPWDDGPEQSND